jgi:hypothetical protein
VERNIRPIAAGPTSSRERARCSTECHTGPLLLVRHHLSPRAPWPARCRARARTLPPDAVGARERWRGQPVHRVQRARRGHNRPVHPRGEGVALPRG